MLPAFNPGPLTLVLRILSYRMDAQSLDRPVLYGVTNSQKQWNSLQLASHCTGHAGANIGSPRVRDFPGSILDCTWYLSGVPVAEMYKPW
jgi:hypothetical protein